MRKPKKEIQLTSYDELLGINEAEQNTLNQIVEVPLNELHPFRNHPFHVNDDEKMAETVESIKNYGILNPALVRPRAEGGYELIAGHRRKRGCELAGKSKMPVLIRNYTDDEAVIVMVDSNIQRENLLPKVLYGLMLDRMALSIRHQWFDEEGKVYIIFTVEQVIQYMNCGRDKAMKTLAELDTKKGIGLIERVKQGFGKPDIIYVKNFILRTSKDVKNNDESEESIQQNREVEEVDLSESEKSTYRGRKNRLQGVGKTDFKRSENTTYRGRKIRTTEVGKTDPNNTNYNYTDISNTDRSNTDLINLSDSSEQQSMDLMEEMELFQMNTALVKRNIEYDCLVQRCRLGEQQQLDEIVALIVETISIERENITISGVKYPYQFVKSRLLLLEESHIEYVLDCLHENTREVKNIKAYLLTCLMNSITTIGNYYQAKVNHDMYGGGI